MRAGGHANKQMDLQDPVLYVRKLWLAHPHFQARIVYPSPGTTILVRYAERICDFLYRKWGDVLTEESPVSHRSPMPDEFRRVFLSDMCHCIITLLRRVRSADRSTKVPDGQNRKFNPTSLKKFPASPAFLGKDMLTHHRMRWVREVTDHHWTTHSFCPVSKTSNPRGESTRLDRDPRIAGSAQATCQAR